MKNLKVQAAIGILCLVSGAASAQLRVANWNFTNYSGGRIAEFQTAFYGVVPTGLALAGKSFAPDVLIGEEFASQAAVDAFRVLLNTAPGSPGDWASAPFIDGPDSDTAFFYRTSKIQFVQAVTISLVNGSTSLPPRNTNRYDIRLVGYGTTPATSLACYGTHMKAGSATGDQSRRLLEANKIRDNANGIDTNGAGTKLPEGWNFLIGGDFNIQASTQAAYQRMVQSESNNTGRFFDPINSPGTWNNNIAFRFIHTQDPADPAGGMDDRHDQLLLSASLIDGAGLDYIGNQSLTFSTSTWNDPNHSYRCWGNDGTSYNTTLTTTGNAMVGATIAQALVTSAQSLGHLPVYLDMRVPPQVASDSVIDFGSIAVGGSATQPLSVSNAGNVALWTAAGISNLRYTLTPSSGFTAPTGVFTDAAGGGANSHLLSMDTSTPGHKTGTLTIRSDDPDQPSRVVTLVGDVVQPFCAADFNHDQSVDFFDYIDFVDAFTTSAPAADFNNDQSIDFFDYLDFVNAFTTAC
jgi:hypothetical protein